MKKELEGNDIMKKLGKNICERADDYAGKRAKKLGKSFVVTQKAVTEIHMAYQQGAVDVMNEVGAVLELYALGMSPAYKCLEVIMGRLNKLGENNQ